MNVHFLFHIFSKGHHLLSVAAPVNDFMLSFIRLAVTTNGNFN